MTSPKRIRQVAVLGAGVFLSGLELMITAVALPSILENLADWTQLRHASWIVNGYLLVYVVTMPSYTRRVRTGRISLEPSLYLPAAMLPAQPVK